MLRLFAAIALLTFGGQTFLPGLHHLVEPHRVCPEHGELLEVEATASGASAALDRAPHANFLPSDTQGDEHGHCEVSLGSRSEHAPLAAAAIEFTSSLVSSNSAPKAAVFTISGVDRYRVAPKQGPPSNA